MMITMRGKFLQLLVVFFILFVCSETSGGNCLVGAELNVLCLKGEREALLRFKQGFKNPPLDPLLSWEAEEDCCRWKEVGCNNITGHVTTLDLHSSGLFDLSQGEFLQSLLGLPYLRYLDLSQNDFQHAQIPELLGSLQNLEHLNLFKTNFWGTIPDHLGNLSRLQFLDLSYNSFWSPLPHFPPNLKTLVLSEGSFFGPLSHICEMLSHNNSLSYMKLSGNRLSGSLPDCWTNGQHLLSLDLSNNSLSGPIPNSMGDLVHLNTLVLSKNNLSGEVPISLKDCTSLVILDLSYNRLAGEIPSWIGGSVLNLLFLSLHSNSFHGGIPGQLCQLKTLMILDISANHISGNIPRCIRNFIGMADPDTLTSYVYPDSVVKDYQMLVPTYIRSSALLTVKNREYVYPEKYLVFFFIALIDLSSNDISGEVPQELASLTRLISLNLSNNQLAGTIPSSLSALKNLEYLDLSRNQLSCTIPSNLVDLVVLGIFNVSYNKLSGSIPRGFQFDTFCKDSYSGNDNLCGLPLAKSCSRNDRLKDPKCGIEESSGNNESSQEDGGSSRRPLYISIAIGFATGYWGFLGTFLFHRTRRHAYYRFLDNTYDKIYVTVAIQIGRLNRNVDKFIQAPECS